MCIWVSDAPDCKKWRIQIRGKQPRRDDENGDSGWCVFTIDLVPAHLSHQHLRSAETGTLLVPHARTTTGQWSFAVNGPPTWNHLPLALWSPDLLESTFKRAQNTHLFSTARRHWDIFIILAPDINIQTYLLKLTWKKGRNEFVVVFVIWQPIITTQMPSIVGVGSCHTKQQQQVASLYTSPYLLNNYNHSALLLNSVLHALKQNSWERTINSMRPCKEIWTVCQLNQCTEQRPMQNSSHQPTWITGWLNSVWNVPTCIPHWKTVH